MVLCTNCGKENQPHYKYCLYCGSGIAGPEGATQEPPEGTTIPARPPALASNTPLQNREVEVTETPLPTPRPPPAHFSIETAVVSGSRPPQRVAEPTMRPEAPTRMCPNCKALVPVGFQFCGQCGGRVEAPKRAQSSALGGRLVLVRPDGSEGGHHALQVGINLVGRGSGPLFDADSYLSPLHLQIEVHEGGSFTLRDAGSLNGVFIKLTEEEPVSDGAVFRIGQELLRFDEIRMPRPLEDGTEIMGSPNPGYWGRIAIIIGRAQDGSCFPLFGDAVVLGRERGDILFAEDGYVSGTHARISYRHGQVYLQDLASSNGTFLKVRGERTVKGGTFVLMGQQLFRVVAG